MIEVTSEAAQVILGRLLDRTVMPDGEEGCWLHQGNPSSQYPTIHVQGRYYVVHVLAHMILNPDDPTTPERPMTLHWCGNKRCWRPGHLRAGSRAENYADAQRHGTLPIVQCGTISGARTHYRNGEKPCDSCREVLNTYNRRERTHLSNA